MRDTISSRQFGLAVREARTQRKETLEEVAHWIAQMDAKYLGEIERGWHAPNQLPAGDTQGVASENNRRTRSGRLPNRFYPPLAASVGALLAEEAVRTRRFAGIGVRGEDAGRRPWVIGSGLDVWEIVQMVEDFGSIGRLLAETQLTERQVRLALAYRESCPDEVAEATAQNRRAPEEWHELYPFVEFSTTT